MAVSGGWSPVVHLHSQRQGKLRWDDALVAFVPSPRSRASRSWAPPAAASTLDGCLAEGARAGAAAAFAAGFVTGSRTQPPVRRPVGAEGRRPHPAAVGGARRDGTPDDWTTTSSTCSGTRRVADVLRATGAGMRSVEHIKRYTSISTANDQGKTSASTRSA